MCGQTERSRECKLMISQWLNTFCKKCTTSTSSKIRKDHVVVVQCVQNICICLIFWQRDNTFVVCHAVEINHSQKSKWLFHTKEMWPAPLRVASPAFCLNGRGPYTSSSIGSYFSFSQLTSCYLWRIESF